VLKPQLGTEPRVFYIAADAGVAGNFLQCRAPRSNGCSNSDLFLS
jgi:hypothetical protein